MKGKIVNGDQSHIQHILMNLRSDREYVWEVKQKVKRQTDSQRNLYFAWISKITKEIVEYTGYTKDEVHEFLKRQFLNPKVVKIGEREDLQYSTKDLDVKEMMEFMTQVDRWAIQELGISVPIPQEMHLHNYSTKPHEQLPTGSGKT